ncbi:hypothetical protein [Agaribacter marinus]|uniref:hypothetical protein n=1 Tax=Agaribacter marinus TaxID=1431249 RepID=UPI0024E0B841|nr:hypothetical protein [Agaribacter marinus]
MLKRTLSFTSLVFFYFLVSVVIHEAGHAFTGKVLGLGTPIISIWPGIELFPNIGASISTTPWPENAIAYVSFIPEATRFVIEFPEYSRFSSLNPKLTVVPVNTNQENYFPPIVGLMGSGATYLMSLFCTLYLYFFKPKGICRILAVWGAFLFYDILCYTVFPVFFGMSHLIFIGGNHPEPIIFLANMGIPFEIAVTLVISICVAQIAALCYISRKEGLFKLKVPNKQLNFHSSKSSGYRCRGNRFTGRYSK